MRRRGLCVLSSGVAATLLLLLAHPLFAQNRDNRTRVTSQPLSDVELRLLRSGVPSGVAGKEVLELSLADAVSRGLGNNLATVLGQERVSAATGKRNTARAELLPDISFETSFRRSEFSLDASFFRDFPPPTGEDQSPGVIGPLNVWDGRLWLEQPLFDKAARAEYSATRAALEAEQRGYQRLRDLAVLAIGNLYLGVVADTSRAEVARIQEETARSLRDLAQSRHDAGVVAGIEVVRAEVQLQAREQESIVAEARVAKSRLDFAHAIGLPASAIVHPDANDGLSAGARPSSSRKRWPPHFKAVKTGRLHASASSNKQDSSERPARIVCPRSHSRRISAPSDRRPTTSTTPSAWAPVCRLPIYRGGRTAGKIEEQEAKLRTAQAERDSLEAAIQYQVEATSARRKGYRSSRSGRA